MDDNAGVPGLRKGTSGEIYIISANYSPICGSNVMANFATICFEEKIAETTFIHDALVYTMKSFF